MVVVLPASMCAMMPMLRIDRKSCSGRIAAHDDVVPERSDRRTPALLPDHKRFGCFQPSPPHQSPAIVRRVAFSRVDNNASGALPARSGKPASDQ